MEAIEYTCSICGKPIATEKGLKIHTTRMHGMAAEGDAIDPTPVDMDGLDEPRPTPADGSPYFVPEHRPEPPKKGWRDKLWGSSETKPVVRDRPRKRRVSTEGIWSTTWMAGGLALQRSGADIPVGRCMQFQAPIVGDILDEAVAGTFIDTLLQPIAGSGKRFKKVSAVVSLPILVGLIERSPQVAPMVEPLLRQVIREHLVALSVQAKKVRKEEAEYRKAMEELGMDVEGSEDPVTVLLNDIFSMPVGAPETNGTKAHEHA